jgi:hypothetical protein
MYRSSTHCSFVLDHFAFFLWRLFLRPCPLTVPTHIRTIQEYVGHKDARTTWNNYNFDRSGKEEQIEHLNKARLSLSISGITETTPNYVGRFYFLQRKKLETIEISSLGNGGDGGSRICVQILDFQRF